MSEEKQITLDRLFNKFFGKKKKKQLSYLSVQNDFPYQAEYIYQLSKKLYEMILKGEISDSQDLFDFIKYFQGSYSKFYYDDRDLFSKIFFYLWIGGDRCRYNLLDKQCTKSIESINKVFEKFRTYFIPFIPYDPSQMRANQILGLFGNKRFVITLSQTEPSTFVVYYYNPTDEITYKKRIGTNENFIQEMERLRTLSFDVSDWDKIRNQEQKKNKSEEISKKYKSIEDINTVQTDPRLFQKSRLTEEHKKYGQYLNDLNEEFERYELDKNNKTQHLYEWLGGTCEWNQKSETICRKNIDHFIQISELYGSYFQPFKKRVDAIDEIMENKVPYLILLSDKVGKYLYLEKQKNEIKGDIYTFDQLLQKINKSTPVNLKEGRDEGRDEQEYLKKIMKEIFHNDKLDDKKLIWILRWIGIDCPFDNNKVCKNRFDILIKLRKEYEAVFNHLFDNFEDIVMNGDFDPNYTYLFLSDTTPGKFKYIYYDKDSEDIKSIESIYDAVIGTIQSNDTFIKYLDECEPNISTGQVNCVKGKSKRKASSSVSPRSQRKKSSVDTLYVFDFDLTLTSLFTCNSKTKPYTREFIDPKISKEKEDEIFYNIMGSLKNDNINNTSNPFVLDNVKKEGTKNIEAFKNFVNQEMRKGNKVAIASFGTKEIISKVMDKIFDTKSPFDPNKDIITEQDYGNGNGCKQIPKDAQRSKLNYIEEIMNRNNIQPKKIYLIDDSKENIDIIKKDTKINGIPIQGIHIPTSAKYDDAPNPGFITTLNKIKETIQI